MEELSILKQNFVHVLMLNIASTTSAWFLAIYKEISQVLPNMILLENTHTHTILHLQNSKQVHQIFYVFLNFQNVDTILYKQ